MSRILWPRAKASSSLLGTEILLDKGTGIGMREDDVELREKLDGAIGEMKKDGSLNDLIRKWFGESALTF